MLNKKTMITYTVTLTKKEIEHIKWLVGTDQPETGDEGEMLNHIYDELESALIVVEQQE